MKTNKIKWGDRTWEFYQPKMNRKRQSVLLSLCFADIILPMTFGVGIAVTKLITKLNPLFLYK